MGERSVNIDITLQRSGDKGRMVGDGARQGSAVCGVMCDHT